MYNTNYFKLLNIFSYKSIVTMLKLMKLKKKPYTITTNILKGEFG